MAAADALDEAVLIVDAGQDVTHANAAAERLLDDGPLANRSAAEILGMGILDLLGKPTTATGPVLRPLPGAGSGLTATAIAVCDSFGEIRGTLVVLRDAMICDNVEDDRPPAPPGFYEALNELAATIIDRNARINPHHYTEKERRDATERIPAFAGDRGLRRSE